MKKFLVIFLLGWMLAGCGIGKVSFAVETPTPTKHTATEVSLAPTETPLPEPTVIAPAPTPDPPKSTATAPQTCVAPRADALFSAGTMMDFPQAVLNFMNQGGTAETLAAGLQTLGFSNPFGPVAVADFTGDGYLDLAVSLMDPAALDQPPLPGVLEIFVCLNGAYFLAYDQPAEAGYTLGEHLWLWQDLNADGAAELVMSDALCGASTCFDNVKILVWDGNTFTNRLADRTDRTDDLPNPKVEVADLDGDRIFDLVVTAGGISSAAAGPPRGKIRTWTYDAAQGVWVFAKDTLAPSNFRIHLLHDADTAANQGNDAQALEWYDRVINDNSLLDFVDPETEQANLA
ncbi:MAG: hypothetical protein H6636_13960, partial [Anaerolineales bacterium]|nr:hypothetical protein [Anaerolineales bacterium]